MKEVVTVVMQFWMGILKFPIYITIFRYNNTVIGCIDSIL